MHAATLARREVLTVGETWSATPQSAVAYSAPGRKELSMVFQFEHVTTFWDSVLGKWKPKPIELPVLRQIFAKWQEALHIAGWNSLFWSNHDLPRAVSRYGDEVQHRVASAKMLASVLHLMQGTPYVYQGEEIGMTNAGFTRIDQYRDLETLNFHEIQLSKGIPEPEFLAGARANSRDNARTPMQWSASPQAGFTTGRPWIEINANYPRLNVASDRADPDGVFERYRKLIALRKELAVIRSGSFRLLDPENPAVFAFERRLGSELIVVIANFTAHTAAFTADEPHAVSGIDLFTGKLTRQGGKIPLGPYETMAIKTTG